MKFSKLIVVLGLLFVAGVCSASIASKHLRCEYLSNPLGIGTVKPRLSWILTSPQRGEKQSAYQILVASTRQLLAKNEGDLWNSGEVRSDRSIGVVYAGKPLHSR